MKLLDKTLQIRCDETLIPRLKRIAESKGDKYGRIAREELERFIRAEEAKIEQKSRLRKRTQ